MMRIDKLRGIREQSQYNVVVLGDAKVGKTALVTQCIFNSLRTSYKPTIEDCYRTLARLPDGKYKTVNLVDTAGAMDFPAMKELRIRSATAIIIVYNVTNAHSITKASSLIKQVHEMRECDGVPITVIGNLWGAEAATSQYQIPFGIKEDSTCQHVYIELSSNSQCKEIFDTVIKKCYEINSWKVEVLSFGLKNKGGQEKKIASKKRGILSYLSFRRKKKSSKMNHNGLIIT